MKTKFLSLAVALSCTTAYAAPALPSSSGDLRALEQNRATQGEAAAVTNEDQATTLAGTKKFYLEQFVFSGADELDKNILTELVQGYYQREVDFNEVQQAVNTITAYLRGQGYAVATAFLPPQQITEHTVEIRIVLGHLGQAEVNNNSKLTETQAQKFIASLQAGELLQTKKLETVLNNINDMAGVAAVGLLRAGDQPGTSNFIVDVENTKAFDTVLYTDNYGNKYSGRYRYGFQTTLNNPGRIGDKLFVGGMLSNDDLHNYNFGYETPLGSRGTKLGVSYSLMDYTLGDFYNVLDAVGRAKTFSIYGSTPLVNTSANYLAAAYGFDNR